MPGKGTCTRPAEHDRHLCELQQRLTSAELAPLLKDPGYICSNCGGRTRSARNLCRPRRLKG